MRHGLRVRDSSPTLCSLQPGLCCGCCRLHGWQSRPARCTRKPGMCLRAELKPSSGPRACRRGCGALSSELAAHLWAAHCTRCSCDLRRLAARGQACGRRADWGRETKRHRNACRWEPVRLRLGLCARWRSQGLGYRAQSVRERSPPPEAQHFCITPDAVLRDIPVAVLQTYASLHLSLSLPACAAGRCFYDSESFDNHTVVKTGLYCC